MWIPITLFIMIAVIIVVPQILKSRDRQKMYEVMRVAYERGQTPTPEMLGMISRDPATGAPVTPGEMPLIEPPSTPHGRDLRRGVAWTAIGVGLLVIALIGYAVGYYDGWAVEWVGTWSSLAAIPLCVGLAFLALWRFSRPKPTIERAV